MKTITVKEAKKIKAITVKEAKKIKVGTWVQVWYGEDIEKIDSIETGIVTENDVYYHHIHFLGTNAKEDDGVDYEQIVKVGMSMQQTYSEIEDFVWKK